MIDYGAFLKMTREEKAKDFENRLEILERDVDSAVVDSCRHLLKIYKESGKEAAAKLVQRTWTHLEATWSVASTASIRQLNKEDRLKAQKACEAIELIEEFMLAEFESAIDHDRDVQTLMDFSG